MEATAANATSTEGTLWQYDSYLKPLSFLGARLGKETYEKLEEMVKKEAAHCQAVSGGSVSLLLSAAVFGNVYATSSRVGPEELPILSCVYLYTGPNATLTLTTTRLRQETSTEELVATTSWESEADAKKLARFLFLVSNLHRIEAPAISLIDLREATRSVRQGKTAEEILTTRPRTAPFPTQSEIVDGDDGKLPHMKRRMEKQAEKNKAKTIVIFDGTDQVEVEAPAIPIPPPHYRPTLSAVVQSLIEDVHEEKEEKEEEEAAVPRGPAADDVDDDVHAVAPLIKADLEDAPQAIDASGPLDAPLAVSLTLEDAPQAGDAPAPLTVPLAVSLYPEDAPHALDASVPLEEPMVDSLTPADDAHEPLIVHLSAQLLATPAAARGDKPTEDEDTVYHSARAEDEHTDDTRLGEFFTPECSLRLPSSSAEDEKMENSADDGSFLLLTESDERRIQTAYASHRSSTAATPIGVPLFSFSQSDNGRTQNDSDERRVLRARRSPRQSPTERKTKEKKSAAHHYGDDLQWVTLADIFGKDAWMFDQETLAEFMRAANDGSLHYFYPQFAATHRLPADPPLGPSQKKQPVDESSPAPTPQRLAVRRRRSSDSDSDTDTPSHKMMKMAGDLKKAKAENAELRAELEKQRTFNTLLGAVDAWDEESMDEDLGEDEGLYVPPPTSTTPDYQQDAEWVRERLDHYIHLPKAIDATLPAKKLSSELQTEWHATRTLLGRRLVMVKAGAHNAIPRFTSSLIANAAFQVEVEEFVDQTQTIFDGYEELVEEALGLVRMVEADIAALPRGRGKQVKLAKKHEDARAAFKAHAAQHLKAVHKWQLSSRSLPAVSL